MLTKTIKYTDYNGQEREDTFYFNLSKVELTRLEVSHPGGYQSYIKKLSEENDAEKVMELLEDLVLTSYGVRCSDGRFEKSKELSKKFSETVAYEKLIMELLTNSDEASAFANGIVPQDLLNKAKEENLIKTK